jgi:hypothetical protein
MQFCMSAKKGHNLMAMALQVLEIVDQDVAHAAFDVSVSRLASIQAVVRRRY